MICKYRIVLSVDGAGIKGLIPLKILDYLHQSITQIDDEIDVTSWVDVFASTSASSIFTGALMIKDENSRTKHTPKEILDFYIRRGTQIFSHNIGTNPENSTYPLTFILNYFFGQVNTRDLKNHYLFLSYNQNQEELFSFSNAMERYYNLPLSHVMSACSAIPNIYPPLKLGSIELCDALFKIQNPSELAYTYARLFYPEEHIIMISIGTGEDQNQKESELSKQVLTAHNKMTEMTDIDKKLSYFRFQPKLQEKFDVTKVDNKTIEELLDITEDYIFKNMAIFQELLQLVAFKAA